MSDTLKTKNVLITGASGYLGLALSELFAKHGANLALQYRNNQKSLEHIKNISNQNSPLLYPCDLSISNDRKSLIKRVVDDLGKIDVLINNAGDAIEYTPYNEADIDLYRRSMEINFLAPFEICRDSLESMPTGGVIINISSNSVKYGGGVKGFHYTCAKAALECFSQGFSRIASQRNVLVNIIRIGLMEGGLSKNLSGYSPKDLEKRKTLIPLKQAVDPHEVAELCLHLASGKMKTMTGTILTIAGGE